jgi:hypothetical protein
VIRETLSTLSATMSGSVLPADFTAVKKAAGMISPKPLNHKLAHTLSHRTKLAYAVNKRSLPTSATTGENSSSV